MLRQAEYTVSSHTPETAMYTVASLKAEHKTLVAAKTAHKVKASSWQALANKLNKPPLSKALAIAELKAAIYQRFSVDSTSALCKAKNGISPHQSQKLSSR
jgi:hypothetical protein